MTSTLPFHGPAILAAQRHAETDSRNRALRRYWVSASSARAAYRNLTTMPGDHAAEGLDYAELSAMSQLPHTAGLLSRIGRTRLELTIERAVAVSCMLSPAEPEAVS